uniref:Uncharacterized protein n=1 Tax=Arundo donax TaxID=35708 RepID=A0A0A9CMB7_ARUDO
MWPLLPFLAPEQGGFLDCSVMEVGLMGISVEKRFGRDLVESSRQDGLPPLPRPVSLVVGGEAARGSPQPIAAPAPPPDFLFFSIATKNRNPPIQSKPNLNQYIVKSAYRKKIDRILLRNKEKD